jgi:two-component system, OmpR family, sensor histidine kinase KdpD
LQLNEQELRVAGSVFQNGRPAGKFAENLPEVEAVFFPLRGGQAVLGVVGLRSSHFPLSLHQRNLLEAFTEQIALAIDRLHMREVLEESKLILESERLTKTLLNSISHEIRTPLAVIEAAGSNLVEFDSGGLSEHQRTMIAEIREATGRLNRLVGNVLDMTRLESGHVRPKQHFHEVGEFVSAAVAESRKLLAEHKVIVAIEPELPFIRVDAVLIHHVLINLLANAAFHTPAGTVVEVTARTGEGVVIIEVADRGPGVDPVYLARLFEKFYRVPATPTGGMGLGLSIVKGFVEAQGGQVKAENRAGGGMIFTILLPIDNASLALAGHDSPIHLQTTR